MEDPHGRHPLVIASFALLVLLAAAVFLAQPRPAPAPATGNGTMSVVAGNLTVPWGLAFLPSGDLLVTERPGRVLRVDREDGSYIDIRPVEGVVHRGEGGLLGVAAHPDFGENRYVYLYMTTRVGDRLQNRVVRYRLDGDRLRNATTVIDGLPGAVYHDGGRIAFGPDGLLYITAGDATQPRWAQDRDRLAGKILRIRPNGSIPSDNPFGTAVYSYGHRNPQGLTWLDGQLWATEHGDSQHDELNRIVAGGNYGWPVIEAGEARAGMRTPAAFADGTTWAPAGAAAIGDSIVFAGLRGAALYRAQVENGAVARLDTYWQNRFGRLRAVAVGPDGDLYVSTSNRDGRGRVRQGDDRIIRVAPSALFQN